MTARKKAKRGRKKTGAKTGTNLVAQPHGGAINQGAPAHPVAGTGRPPSAVRAVLREAYEDRIPFLQALADGKPITLRVATTSKNSKGERTVTSKRRVFTPGVGERLAAMEQLARYGIGTTKEVSVDAVKAKVEAMLNVLKEHLEPELYQRLLPELRQAFLTA
jgi:hypothetical protein